MTFSENADTSLVSAVSTEQKTEWALEVEIKGDFVLATDQITVPPLISPPGKQSWFCFLMSCKPLKPENTGENQN